MAEDGTETQQQPQHVRMINRVKFHREDLKSKFSAVRWHRTEPAEDIDSSVTAGADQQTTKWFKKIFNHHHHQHHQNRRPCSFESSDHGPLRAVSGDDEGDVASGEDDDSSDSGALSLDAAKSCEADFLHARNPLEAPPPPRRRSKSKFRLLSRRISNASSRRSQASPAEHHSLPALVRASSTGTLASNAGGGMTRRSYRLKLDSALKRAHLSRRLYGVDPTSCGDNTSEGSGSGFMMQPDATDECKVQCTQVYESVVLEASRDARGVF